jgi:hypothetical protein
MFGEKQARVMIMKLRNDGCAPRNLSARLAVASLVYRAIRIIFGAVAQPNDVNRRWARFEKYMIKPAGLSRRKTCH